jgi:hypothetical protein
MGDVLTEGSFLQRAKGGFIESIFGQRYTTTKPRALEDADVSVRAQVWTFSIRGSHGKVGVPESWLQNTAFAGETLLQDWYPLVRDMAKRALKYKHLPVTLSDYNMLRYYMDIYYYVVANLTVLLNLNRLGQFNVGFANICVNLPRVMSRVQRLWRRTSALSIPSFVRDHALRNGQIAYATGILAPTIRFWSNEYLLVTGGPSITALNEDPFEMLVTLADLETFVTNLETAERWLEIGTAGIATDFTAVKDLIDMCSDIVPGAFVTGLPRSDAMPGLTPDPTLLTDLLRRAVFCKDAVDQATDRWTIFPVPAATEFGGRFPVVGFGTPSVYDFLLLGAPKYGYFNAGLGTKSADVDSICMIPGTDHRVRANLDIGQTAFADIFGVNPAPDEVFLGDTTPDPYISNNSFDHGDAAAILAYFTTDSIFRLHPWDDIRWNDRNAWAAGWQHIVDENTYGYLMWMDPEDLGENYAEFLAKSLGIPYIGHPMGV